MKKTHKESNIKESNFKESNFKESNINESNINESNINESNINDPYKLLGLDTSSTKEQIDKAYTKLRIKYHPDRKTGDRVMYDRIVEAYEKIQHALPHKYIEVDAFIKEYKDSEEEVKDLIELYKKFKGDINKIINYHLLTEEEDEERIRKIINQEINTKGIKEYKKYKERKKADSKKLKEKEKKAEKKKAEKKKAEQLALEMGLDLNQSLEEILNRSIKKEKKFIEDLETKYCKRLE